MIEKYKGPLYLSTAASLWGGMYVASKYALDAIPPFTLLFLRYVLASFILLWWCRCSKIEVIPRQDRWGFIQISFFGYFLSLAAQFIGTQLSSAHMGAVITCLSPVFQSGFAILLLGEKMSRKQVLALAFSLVGVFIVTGVSDLNDGEAYHLGNLYFVAAACLWGYYSILSKKLSDRHPTLRITTFGIVLATLLALPPAWLELRSWDIGILESPLILCSVLYLSLFATTIAYYCWNKGLALTHPHQAGLFFFLQAVVGSVLGCLLLAEMLSVTFIIGSLLILAGVSFVLR